MKAACGKTARAVWAAGGGQREGIIQRASPDPTPSIAATNNAAGGKGPCGGLVDRAVTCEGMTGQTGSNYPAGPKPNVKVRYLRHQLRSWPSRALISGTMLRLARPPVSRVREIRTHGLNGGLAHIQPCSDWRQ